MINLLICFLLLLCISGCKMLEEKKEKNETLSLDSEFEWTIGDWVAYRLSEEYNAIYRIFGFGFDSGPRISGIIRAFYNREKSAIIMEVRGPEKTPKKAKENIKLLLDEIEEIHIPRFNRECGINLKKTDFQAIYINIEREKEIVRWENGKYLLPED